MNEKTENIFASRSEYYYEVVGRVIAITDEGGLKSVTNDMENVLQDIKKEIGDISPYQIMYKDSLGIWDGVKVGPNGSVSFFSINETEYASARVKLLANLPAAPVSRQPVKPMQNKRMQQKIAMGHAIDVSDCPLASDGDPNHPLSPLPASYILPEFKEGMDYCDSQKEVWIWSIGKHLETGQILAATDGRFYENPEYKCLFLR
ncbi:MAG: hypothetical protein ACO1OF_16455 [Adhaeribacter sp.]